MVRGNEGARATSLAHPRGAPEQRDSLSRERTLKKISIVTPCYNEEAGIRECYLACKRVFDEQLADYELEHIFIDNCSRDRTVEVLRGIAAEDKHVKVIVNSRNFGANRSPLHGYYCATGDAIIPIFADLQTPPTLIPELVAHWEKGFRIVAAIKRPAREGFVMTRVRGLFYLLIRKISHIEQIPNFIGFGLYDRSIIDIIKSLAEPDPYFRGLVSEIGFEKQLVIYDVPERQHGRSRHSIFDLIDFAFTGIFSYSKAPIRVMTLVGFMVSCLSFVCGFVYFIAKLLFWYSLPLGMAPVVIATFMLGSIQIFALGVVGEYVGLLLQYARRFPLVIEKERINFDDAKPPARDEARRP